VRPSHDVDVLLPEHLVEQRAFARAPRRMVSIEKPADQHIGFLGAAMVRAPGEALMFRVGRHVRHVGAGSRRGKAGLSAAALRENDDLSSLFRAWRSSATIRMMVMRMCGA